MGFSGRSGTGVDEVDVVDRVDARLFRLRPVVRNSRRLRRASWEAVSRLSNGSRGCLFLAFDVAVDLGENEVGG
jgi:hypothetical protein